MAQPHGHYPGTITHPLLEAFAAQPNYAITPAGVSRNVQLASVLEPLVYSPCKTTRESDCAPDQRLAFFLTAGINIGEPFRQIAERLLQAKENAEPQPPIFDLGYLAQAESKRQRAGGRTNQVIICMLLPLVAAQIMYLEELPNPDNIDKVFDNINTVLRNTTYDDVVNIKNLEKLGYGLSGWSEWQAEVDLFDGRNVYEFYRAKCLGVNGVERQDVKRPAYYEFTHGYPVARALVSEVLTLEKLEADHGFQHIFSKACTNVRKQLPDTYAGGLLADNTAAALYMILSHYPHSEVVF